MNVLEGLIEREYKFTDSLARKVSKCDLKPCSSIKFKIVPFDMTDSILCREGNSQIVIKFKKPKSISLCSLDHIISEKETSQISKYLSAHIEKYHNQAVSLTLDTSMINEVSLRLFATKKTILNDASCYQGVSLFESVIRELLMNRRFSNENFTIFTMISTEEFVAKLGKTYKNYIKKNIDAIPSNITLQEWFSYIYSHIIINWDIEIELYHDNVKDVNRKKLKEILNKFSIVDDRVSTEFNKKLKWEA